MSDEKTTPFVSLILPVYQNLKEALNAVSHLRQVLENTRYDYEIIVVVDGIDQKKLTKLTDKKLSKITFFGYEKHEGKAYAIRQGMNKAQGDYVMFIDSGREIDPNGVSMLLEHMEWYNADIIVGSKRHLASKVNYPLERKILSYGYYWLVKVLFGISVHDTQAGIKVFKKKVLKKILPKLVEKKFAGDLEMLVVARHLGFAKIYEAPIKLNYRLAKVTSAATMRSIAGILIDTLAIFYRLNFLHYYDRSI